MFFDEDKQLKKEFLKEYYDELGDLEFNIKEVKLKINKKLDKNILDNNLCYLDEDSILDCVDEKELLLLYPNGKKAQEYLDADTNLEHTEYESIVIKFREDIIYIVGILSIIDKQRKTYFNEAHKYSENERKNIIAYKFIKLVHSKLVNRFVKGKYHNLSEINKYKNSKSECRGNNIQLKEYVYKLIEMTIEDPQIIERFNEIILKLGGSYEI